MIKLTLAQIFLTALRLVGVKLRNCESFAAAFRRLAVFLVASFCLCVSGHSVSFIRPQSAPKTPKSEGREI